MSNLVERLRDVGCDREPFTPDHAKCVCRLTNEAAAEITRLRAALAARTEECAKVAEEMAATAKSLAAATNIVHVQNQRIAESGQSFAIAAAIRAME